MLIVEVEFPAGALDQFTVRRTRWSEVLPGATRVPEEGLAVIQAEVEMVKEEVLLLVE
jgi:hypothetical protein